MARMVTDCAQPRGAESLFARHAQSGRGDEQGQQRLSSWPRPRSSRLAVLTALDQEQKRVMDAREEADRKTKGLVARGRRRCGLRSQGGRMYRARPRPPARLAPATPEPAHYFRMMKELALLGLFHLRRSAAPSYCATSRRAGPASTPVLRTPQASRLLGRRTPDQFHRQGDNSQSRCLIGSSTLCKFALPRQRADRLRHRRAPFRETACCPPRSRRLVRVCR